MAGVAPMPPAELTVEAAMTGGQSHRRRWCELGPQARAAASTWTSRCAMRATSSRSATSSSTWRKEGGSMTRVAEKTGLERTHLYRKLKQLGVDLSRGKRDARGLSSPPLRESGLRAPRSRPPAIICRLTAR